MVVTLLGLSCAAALTCRPQLRASQPAKCVRASPPSMTSEADLLRLQEEIQRLQLQAEIIRLQAQVESAAVAAPVVPPPAEIALPQLTAPVPEPVAVPAADVAERLIDTVKDTPLPSSSPADDIAAAAVAAVGAGAQELVTNIDPGSSVGLDRAYPLLVLLCLSILPLLLAIANAAVKAVTGKALFLGRIDTYDPRGPSSSATPKRNAREIFDVGLTNLKAEPTAWLFGAPSALYSNEPPPAVPPPAGLAAPPSSAPPAAPPTAPEAEPAATSFVTAAPQPAAAEIAAPAPQPAAAPTESKGKKNRYTKRAEKKPKGQGTRATRS